MVQGADSGQAFSRITILAEEDDENVIAIGQGAPARQQRTDGNAWNEQHAAVRLQDAPDAAAVADAPDAPSAEAAPGAPVAQKETRRKKDEYRETTLEDLERQPMSLTQKIVIVAVILILVGFFVYYNFVL